MNLFLSLIRAHSGCSCKHRQTSQQDALTPDVRKRENTPIRLYHLQADETQRYRLTGFKSHFHGRNTYVLEHPRASPGSRLHLE
jgi:hypothetical protein